MILKGGEEVFKIVREAFGNIGIITIKSVVENILNSLSVST